MVKPLYYIAKSARPRQWLKNFALFAPIVFSGDLLNILSITLVFWAFVIFSALSSAVYIINDVIDAPADRLHPFKRNRPIAAGKLQPQVALLFAALFIAFALIMSLQFRPAFIITVLVFLGLQAAYSLSLKKIILLDVMAIAASFIIRVYAGAFIIGAHVNVWFLLTVISLSLFLAIGKRRSELTILHGHEKASLHRQTLGHYPPDLLVILTSMFATAAWLTYALFTFNYPVPPPNEFFTNYISSVLPSTIEQSKWLMVTVPFVIYGVMRYLYVVYEKKEGESPERVLLSDKPILITVILWAISVLVLLYGLNL